MNGNFAWGLAWFVAKIPSHSDHSSYKDRANPVCFFFWINKPYLEDKGPPSDKAWDQVADSAREKSVVEHAAKM